MKYGPGGGIINFVRTTKGKSNGQHCCWPEEMKRSFCFVDIVVVGNQNAQIMYGTTRREWIVEMTITGITVMKVRQNNGT